MAATAVAHPEGVTMALVKHGDGKVLLDDEQRKQASKSEWTDEEAAALAAENEEADSEG